MSSPFPLRKTNFPDSFFPLTTPQRGDFSAKDAPSLDLIRRFYDMLEGKTDQYFSVKDDKVILLIEGIRKSSLESRIVEWKELDKNE